MTVFRVPRCAGPNKHGTKIVVHPRVARWIELHRIRTTDRSNGFAIRTESSFNGKRTDDERRGGREREKLSSYDKVSFLGYVTDDSTDRTDSVVRRWIR